MMICITRIKMKIRKSASYSLLSIEESIKKNQSQHFFTDTSVLTKSESVKFLLIEKVICLFTDSPVKNYLSLKKFMKFD